MELKDLKSGYEKLVKKYKLPSFKELNESFEIGRIENDAGTLLRSIRKLMMEKVVNSMSFVEMLLNPMNAPRVYQIYIKNMTLDDRKRIDKIYSSFAKISIVSLEREIDYDEKKEAQLINDILKTWREIKPDFRGILEKILAPSNNSTKKERSYFG